MLPIKTPVAKGLKIQDSEAFFPAGRVFCVGKNYGDHVVEMGGDPLKVQPAIFMKPHQSLWTEAEFNLASLREEVHYEGELVLCVGLEGKDLSPEKAPEILFGYAAGLDLTLREVQARLKKEGKPWEMSKSFDGSAPVGEIVPLENPGTLMEQELETLVNGETKQKSPLGKMIWKPAEILCHLSRTFRLFPGDLVFTGTPAGVGAVRSGDRLTVKISGGTARLDLRFL